MTHYVNNLLQSFDDVSRENFNYMFEILEIMDDRNKCYNEILTNRTIINNAHPSWERSRVIVIDQLLVHTRFVSFFNEFYIEKIIEAALVLEKRRIYFTYPNDTRDKASHLVDVYGLEHMSEYTEITFEKYKILILYPTNIAYSFCQEALGWE